MAQLQLERDQASMRGIVCKLGLMVLRTDSLHAFVADRSVSRDLALENLPSAVKGRLISNVLGEIVALQNISRKDSQIDRRQHHGALVTTQHRHLGGVSALHSTLEGCAPVPPRCHTFETPTPSPCRPARPKRQDLLQSGMVHALDLKLQTSLNPVDTEDSHLRPPRTAAEETPIPTCSAKPIVDFNHFLSAQVREARRALKLAAVKHVTCVGRNGRSPESCIQTCMHNMQGRRFRVGELSNLLFEFAGVPGEQGHAHVRSPGCATAGSMEVCSDAPCSGGGGKV